MSWSYDVCMWVLGQIALRVMECDRSYRPGACVPSRCIQAPSSAAQAPEVPVDRGNGLGED